MKLAITATGSQMTATVDPRFGRAAYFVIIDPGTMAFEAIENTQNLNLPQGAGIQAGKTIVENKVDALVTGNCGPKEVQVLKRAGVKILLGASGTISDAVQQYKAGKLEAAADANVDGHWV